MTIDALRDFLLWCALINYGVLGCWFLAFWFAHAGLHRLHARWFQLSVAQFDAIHYAAMSAYKIGILLLNVAPYLAVRALGHGG